MSAPVLQITLTEESKALLASMPTASGRALRAMAKELDRQNELTIGHAQRNKLSGPRPSILGVVTNRLRSSLRRNEASVSGSTVTGSIGSNVAYAAIHEYGFEGDVQVGSFVRKNRGRNVTNKKGKVLANGISYVRGFTRHMRMPERSFIRSSITERLSEYETALSGAVVAALGGSQ